jgi:hypothetical protein
MIEAKFYDRHGEHIDPTIPLCEHGPKKQLIVGDRFVATAEIGSQTVCEIVIEVVGRNKIEIIVNHLDYIIAREVRALANEKIQ